MVRHSGYQFTTVTPETHRRVNLRAGNLEAKGDGVRDVFGWSRPFRAGVLAPPFVSRLQAAGALSAFGALWRSDLRFASVGSRLYVHSGFPTADVDAVFFGPDTYRFITLIRQMVLRRDRPMTIVDIGCGTGAGGIEAARWLGPAQGHRLILGDVNPKALRYSKVNAELAGVGSAECVTSDVLRNIHCDIDLIVANPPYLIDPAARLYRDGGGELGMGLALRIVEESLSRLARGGQLVLYTGVPVVKGDDVFRRRIARLLSAGVNYDYVEIDPDVFGEELDQPCYRDVDRIAVIGLNVRLT